MTREPTLSERVLLAAALAALILWCLVIVGVSLGYLGPTIGMTWLGRIILLAIGTFTTTRLVRYGIRSWHRAIARPLPTDRGSRWLARQPGWRLAVGCWSLYAAPELSTGQWLSPRGHDAVATTPHIAVLIISALG
ncbi:MAG: hypothetical protein J2P27_17775, partial [Actinobacteria bacterium]|nr:hypothetical protein [Actinomycetota bacterium]